MACWTGMLYEGGREGVGDYPCISIRGGGKY